jgi:anthranilate/para-aminobenzoate synthase component II
MKVFFVDFQDSFSFNILSELYELGIRNVEFIERKEAHFFLQNIQEGVVILGPGPGHPQEYRLSQVLRPALKKKKCFFWGICLGHQLIWESLGRDIIRSKSPMHGRSIEVELNLFWREFFKLKTLKVQRYNSLVVDLENTDQRDLFFKDELIASVRDKFVSYQFHPESIGTDNSQILFARALQHFKVKLAHEQSSTFRNLLS